MPSFSLPLLVPAIRLDHADPDAEIKLALRRARELWCAGFLLFGGEAEQVEALTAELREIAGRDLLIASDMERGAGQQVRGLKDLPGPGLLGLAGSPADAEACGRMTAEDALSVGIDVIFAPVLDVMSEITNPIIGERSFGWDPIRVAALGRAFCRGARQAGALPVAKHFPGHGATRLDSHVARPVVEASEAELEGRDLIPFHALLESGDGRAVMTAHVAFPALDPEGRIATLSPPILQRLRDAASPREAIAVTDALRMEGAVGGVGTTAAARQALQAGCDLLLYADDEEVVATGLVQTEQAEAALGRVSRWLAERRRTAGASGARADEGLGERLAERAVALSWPQGLEAREVLVLDDDDRPERGLALQAAAQAAGGAARIRRLGQDGLPSRAELEAADLVVLIGSVGMGKGPFGLRHARDWGARWAALTRPPALIAMGAWVPGTTAHLPGTQPALERALAARIFASRA